MQKKTITLLSVSRKEFGNSKKVFVTADNGEGVVKELSAFQEAWNDGWNVGDAVAVLIKKVEIGGKTYYNLYPTAEEANTARQPEPRTISDGDAIRTLALSLHAKLEQEFARVNMKLDALAAEKELNDLAGGAIANGF